MNDEGAGRDTQQEGLIADGPQAALVHCSHDIQQQSPVRLGDQVVDIAVGWLASTREMKEGKEERRLRKWSLDVEEELVVSEYWIGRIRYIANDEQAGWNAFVNPESELIIGQNSGELEIQRRFEREARKKFEESAWKEGRTRSGVGHRRKRGRRRKRDGQTACSAFSTSWKLGGTVEAVRTGLRPFAVAATASQSSVKEWSQEKEWSRLRPREDWRIRKEEETANGRLPTADYRRPTFAGAGATSEVKVRLPRLPRLPHPDYPTLPLR
ncbi:hypothetical protein R3P38DRAFT_2804947 [Favolaschia claudopus]|uniref:Uncharacterized protein n=1 Tax=Favolaschia claudopus TaxID=2862362 RepID=A0AAV9ZPV2_9AGAR